METLQTTRATLKDEWGRDLGNPIAVLEAEPDDLARDKGIAFTEGHDDLDSVRIALLKAASGLDLQRAQHKELAALLCQQAQLLLTGDSR